jgi:hypothetical protein
LNQDRGAIRKLFENTENSVRRHRYIEDDVRTRALQDLRDGASTPGNAKAFRRFLCLRGITINNCHRFEAPLPVRGQVSVADDAASTDNDNRPRATVWNWVLGWQSHCSFLRCKFMSRLFVSQTEFNLFGLLRQDPFSALTTMLTYQYNRVHVVGIKVAALTGMEHNICFGNGAAEGNTYTAHQIVIKIHWIH